MKLLIRGLVLFLAVLRTTASFGQSGWTRQNSGTFANLFAVSFVDAQIGAVVGSDGTILHTTDAGDTWIHQESGTTDHLYAVSFVDGKTGTVVGSGGTILRTIDGGDTWIRQESGTTAYLTGVSLVDAKTGVAVGSGGNHSSHHRRRQYVDAPGRWNTQLARAGGRFLRGCKKWMGVGLRSRRAHH